MIKSISARYRYKRDHNKPKYSDTYRAYQFDHFPSPPANAPATTIAIEINCASAEADPK